MVALSARRASGALRLDSVSARPPFDLRHPCETLMDDGAWPGIPTLGRARKTFGAGC